MEAPREEAAEDPTYRFPSVQDEYQAGLTTTTEEEIGAAARGRICWNTDQSRCHPGYGSQARKFYLLSHQTEPGEDVKQR